MWGASGRMSTSHTASRSFSVYPLLPIGAASFAAMVRVRAITGPCLGGAPSGVTPSKLSSKSNCSISKRDVENLSDNKNVY